MTVIHPISCLILSVVTSGVVCVNGVFAASWEGVFEGTLGKSKILVELNAGSEKSEYQGGYAEGSRYSYDKKVFDLNLVLLEDGPTLQFTEIDEIHRIFNEIGKGDERLTGQWSLKVDGDKATGTWTDTTEKKTLPITLKRVALVPSVDLPPATNQLSHTYNQKWMEGVTFKPAGKIETDSSVGMVLETDSAFGMSFPVLEEFPDAARKEAANALLREQYRSEVILMRDCRNGMQRSFRTAEEEEMSSNVERNVTFASPTLLSVEHYGSMFCGGAHPNTFVVPMTYDLTTAERIGGNAGRSGSDLHDFGRILKLASNDERIAFEDFALGRWSTNAAKFGEDGKKCEESGFMKDAATGERDFSLSFVKAGLAIRRTDYPHVSSTCLFQDFNPTIIPWADLKPYLKPDQLLLVNEVK